LKLYYIHIINNVCHGKNFILITRESKNEKEKKYHLYHTKGQRTLPTIMSLKSLFQVRNSSYCHPLSLPDSPLIWKIPLTFKREGFDQNYILPKAFIKHSHQSLGKYTFNRKEILYHIKIKNKCIPKVISSFFFKSKAYSKSQH
jgi:hypothetical protein